MSLDWVRGVYYDSFQVSQGRLHDTDRLMAGGHRIEIEIDLNGNEEPTDEEIEDIIWEAIRVGGIMRERQAVAGMAVLDLPLESIIRIGGREFVVQTVNERER